MIPEPPSSSIHHVKASIPSGTPASTGNHGSNGITPKSATTLPFTSNPGSTSSTPLPTPPITSLQTKQNVVASSSTQLTASTNGSLHTNPIDREAAARKRKWATIGYGVEEVDVMERRATSLHLALLLDQQSTLFPPPPTAFSTLPDVVDRLLPYHIWQIHDEELEGRVKGKRAELKEISDAEGLMRKFQRVQERFAKVRRRTDERAEVPSLISLLHSSTSVVRDEISTLQQSLRSARADYDSLESARKARERIKAEEEARVAKAKATAAAAVPTTPAVSASTSSKTRTASTPVTPGSKTPERGKPRGRPRGRGRGGLREAVLTHTPGGKGTAAEPNTSPAASSTSLSPAPDPPPTSSSTSSSAKSGPVFITLTMVQLPQLEAVGLLVSPANPDGPKGPASIIRTSEDKKTVVLSLDLSACNKAQLHTLAKMLNLGPKLGTSDAITKAAETTTSGPT